MKLFDLHPLATAGDGDNRSVHGVCGPAARQAQEFPLNGHGGIVRQPRQRNYPPGNCPEGTALDVSDVEGRYLAPGRQRPGVIYLEYGQVLFQKVPGQYYIFI